MILGRLAKNDGKGLYAIEQEIQFRTETEPIVLRERWIIENGESMRVTVSEVKGSQEKWQHDIAYMDGKKYYRDEKGGLKSERYPSDFIEPFWHYRSAKSFIDAMIKHKMVPSGFGAEKRIGRLENLKYQPESHVNLARTNGVVSWFLGEPTPASAPKLSSGLWIEQDAFLLRRLRFVSQAEVTADRFLASAGGIKFPRDRVVTWDTNSVTIRTLSVKSVPDSTARQLDPNLVGGNEKVPAKLPELSQVKEFYTRFR